MSSEIPMCELKPIFDGHVPFGRSATPGELFFFSSCYTHDLAQFLSETWPTNVVSSSSSPEAKTLISAQSSLLVSHILDTATKTFVTYYGYCHSRDGATLFSEVDSNKLRFSVKNKITLSFAKFGAGVIYTSVVTSRKTQWPCFLAYPVYLVFADFVVVFMLLCWQINEVL